MASTPPPRIFSRRRRIAGVRRARVRQSQRDAARYILQDMVEDVLERLEFMRLSPARALVIGDWTGTLALSLRGAGAEVDEHDAASLDEERPLDGGPYDLIVSLGSLDRVNDLPGALIQMRALLKPDGLAMATFVGGASLPKLRRIMLDAEPDRPAARMHPLVDPRSCPQLLARAGWRDPVVDSYELTVRYSSFERLVQDLREHALGNVLARPAPPLSRAAFLRAHAAFDAMREEDGKVSETFEIITLTGRR